MNEQTLPLPPRLSPLGLAHPPLSYLPLLQQNPLERAPMDTQSTPQAYEVVIRWTPADLQHLCPYLTDDQAADLLKWFERDIVERSIERGWEVIEWALTQHGYDVDPPYKEYT